jgi:hypothetical protein
MQLLLVCQLTNAKDIAKLARPRPKPKLALLSARVQYNKVRSHGCSSHLSSLAVTRLITSKKCIPCKPAHVMPRKKS